VPDFAWQIGYGAFSVSYSAVPNVRKYILDQERHHETMTWEQEFRALLEKHGIEYDERFFLD
jgi:putative transposase